MYHSCRYSCKVGIFSLSDLMIIVFLYLKKKARNSWVTATNPKIIRNISATIFIEIKSVPIVTFRMVKR